MNFPLVFPLPRLDFTESRLNPSFTTHAIAVKCAVKLLTVDEVQTAQNMD
jgi:hypothetical protein